MTNAVTHNHGASPVVLEFEDNQLLPLLYGDFDRHLARIEQALEVTIASRGNTVTITGEAAATEIARVCLESLYRRLVDGLEVSAGEVDAAVRLARARRPRTVRCGRNRQRQNDHPHTQAASCLLRSPGQQKYIGALLDNDLTFGLGPCRYPQNLPRGQHGRFDADLWQGRPDHPVASGR